MNKSNKLVIINRAIPGGGKTSLTKQIEELAKSLGRSISVHSTDEYFIQIDEEGIRRYVFDKKKLNEYHQNNQEAFKQALENRIDIVVCDNTNFESWQSKPYTDMAREFGYKILLIDFKNRCLRNPQWIMDGILSNASRSHEVLQSIMTMIFIWRGFQLSHRIMRNKIES
ncbi:AAA family ATPase [Helicobacter pylori]|uniref:Uncharacterized protein n=1 Tax=Helicobacter pylori NQ4053 TaxID=992027 RepID=I9QH78_HELPX|nr:AAA family ATPase [Helicobacter pylori]EJB33921.1 hypothetical protein HPNQ4053_0985 [Helicobacter pylori NQ4053]